MRRGAAVGGQATDRSARRLSQPAHVALESCTRRALPPSDRGTARCWLLAPPRTSLERRPKPGHRGPPLDARPHREGHRSSPRNGEWAPPRSALPPRHPLPQGLPQRGPASQVFAVAWLLARVDQGDTGGEQHGASRVLRGTCPSLTRGKERGQADSNVALRILYG